MAGLEVKGKTKDISDIEKAKMFPERYPSNIDSIGIEIVGKSTTKKGEDPIYENVNDKQNASL